MKFFCFLFLSFLTSGLFAIPHTNNITAVSQTTLPLEFNTGNPAPNGLPSTVITIQGKTIPLLFDTGAKKSEITLSKQALKGLQVHFTGNSVCFESFDGKHCEPEFLIPEIILGHFVIKNVKGTLMPALWGGQTGKGFIQTAASQNGVIGYGLLSQFNFVLDYPKHSVTLFQPGGPVPAPFSQWTRIPFSGQLHTSVVLNGKPITLGWDTGSVPSILKKSVAQHMPISSCPAHFAFGQANNCQQLTTQTLTTLAQQPLPQTWFLLAGIPAVAPFDGLIGSNFYSQHLVYFDFDHQSIYVQNAIAS